MAVSVSSMVSVGFNGLVSGDLNLAMLAAVDEHRGEPRSQASFMLHD